MPVYRVPIEYTWNGPGSPGANIFHVRTEGALGADLADLQSAVDAIHGFYGMLLTPATGTGVMTAQARPTLGQVVNVETDETPGQLQWTSFQQPTDSTIAPPHLAIVIGWRTSIAARRGMGRTFVGPLSPGAIDGDGTPTITALDHVKAAAQYLLDQSLPATGWAIAVYGLQTALNWPLASGDSPDNYPHVARDITSYSVKDKFAVRRSRRG